MKIDTETASDEQMAEALAEGLHWLGSGGRSAAKLLVPHIVGDTIDEAAAWIEDIAAGEPIA